MSGTKKLYRNYFKHYFRIVNKRKEPSTIPLLQINEH